jgi:hypothetical protein
MTEAMTQYQLAEARNHIERLAHDAQGGGEEHTRIRRHLEAVRAAEAAAVAAARTAGDRFEGALADLRTRLEIARHRLAAELTDDRRWYERAVEAELREWSAYLGRLESRATAQSDGAPEESELALAELTSRYDRASRRLLELETVPDDIWRERRDEVEAALDELERAADAPNK